jgi:hypothetical protein
VRKNSYSEGLLEALQAGMGTGIGIKNKCGEVKERLR